MLTSNNLCQNSHNLYAARIENLSSGKKKKKKIRNKRTANEMALFIECIYICCICLMWEQQSITTITTVTTSLWLEATELPVLISALVSLRTLPRSRRETTKDQHVHNPYSAVDGKLSLGSLAKITSTKLQALEGSQHPCTLWVLSKDVSLYTLLCHLQRVQIFFSWLILLLGTGNRSGHTFNFSDWHGCQNPLWTVTYFDSDCGCILSGSNEEQLGCTAKDWSSFTFNHGLNSLMICAEKICDRGFAAVNDLIILLFRTLKKKKKKRSDANFW